MTLIIPFLVALGLLVVIYAVIGCAAWLAARVLERRERARAGTRSYRVEVIANELWRCAAELGSTALVLADGLEESDVVPASHRPAVEWRHAQLVGLVDELQDEANSLYRLVTQLRAGEPEWSGLDRRPTALQEREA